MTERKPPGVSFESWIDKQIRDAAERGEFDNLPGAGRPLPGAGQPDDENWWLRGYLRREGVTGETMLPTPLLLRREIEELPATVRRLPSEDRVRASVSALNRRILACLREPSELRVPLRPVNADAVVERWRQERRAGPAAGPTADPTADPAAEPADRAVAGPGAATEPDADPPPAPRRWWQRLGRRR
jgi:hypothetical protein